MRATMSDWNRWQSASRVAFDVPRMAACDSEVASEGLIVQYVAAVPDGGDGDGANKTFFD